jgi:hypothetical protein
MELRMLQGGVWIRRDTPAYTPPAGNYDVTAGQDIQVALDNAPAGGTVRLGPGEYRLTVPLVLKQGQKLFGPVTGPAAVITGDVVLTGWTKDGAFNRWYTTSGNLPAAYNETNGQCEVNTGAGANPCQKRDQVWLDDVHLTRVMSVDQVGTTSFYQDYATGRTYLGVNPSARLVEMSSVSRAFSTTGVNGCSLQHLTVKRFASAAQSAACVIEGTDWEIGYCTFTENHAIGLHLIQSHRTWVHHNTFIRNGQLGMGHYKSHDTVVESNMFTENNTDGFWRADWESGGFKATFSQRTILRNNTSHKNEGVGLWFDIDNVAVEVYGNTMTDNYADGLRFEISFGMKCHDNTVSGNGFRYATEGGRGSDISMFAVGAININSSPDVEIYNNTIGSNQNAIVAQMRNRGLSASGLGPRDLHNLYVHHNTMQLVTGATFGEGVTGLNTLTPIDTTLYYLGEKNNRYDFNTYVVTTTSDKKFAWNHTYLTFAQLQAAGQELNGTVAVAPRPGYRITDATWDGHWTMASTSSFTSGGASTLVGDFDIDNYGRAAFLHFKNILIPQGATIDAAKVEVKAFGIDTAIPTMKIVAHDADSSPLPANRTEMNGRAATTAAATWAPGAWVNNAWTDSPPLTAVIQEIVDRPGWAPGNSITIMIQPDPVAFTTQKRISFRTYDNSPDDGAGLLIDWH